MMLVKIAIGVAVLYFLYCMMKKTVEGFDDTIYWANKPSKTTPTKEGGAEIGYCGDGMLKVITTVNGKAKVQCFQNGFKYEDLGTRINGKCTLQTSANTVAKLYKTPKVGAQDAAAYTVNKGSTKYDTQNPQCDFQSVVVNLA